MNGDNDAHAARGGWSWWYVLFIIQFLLVLWPPAYNKVEPTLIGIPFFRKSVRGA
jgi:hypothetical protein